MLRKAETLLAGAFQAQQAGAVSGVAETPAGEESGLKVKAEHAVPALPRTGVNLGGPGKRVGTRSCLPSADYGNQHVLTPATLRGQSSDNIGI